VKHEPQMMMFQPAGLEVMLSCVLVLTKMLC
jgi:hypothetical protein